MLLVLNANFKKVQSPLFRALVSTVSLFFFGQATEEVDTLADPAPPLIIEEVPTRASREMKRTAADDDDGETTSKKRAVTFLDLKDSVSKPTVGYGRLEF